MIQTRTWIKMIVSFTILSLGLCFFLSFSKKGEIAEIMVDGNVIKRIRLSDAKDQTFVVESENGYNILQIKDGDLSVIEADCKDHSCMKMGSLKKSGMIVCLPHRLIIRLADREIDGVSG